MDQLELRLHHIDKILFPVLPKFKVRAVVGRGGLLKPLAGGTYKVNIQMMKDLRQGVMGVHASNLGAILAEHYGRQFGVDAFIVDPVTVDEFHDLARISGVAWIERKSRAHILNMKAVCRRTAAQIGIPLVETDFVVAHLGGGISIGAMQGGKLIDVNDALLGMGPFSPERAGALPIGPLVEKCYSGEFTKNALLEELSHRSGLMGYCGTSDVRAILHLINSGDQSAALALRAMVYQIAKEIGAMAAVLKGRLDGVIITGGIVHSDEVVAMLRDYITFLGPIFVHPGEGELQALAEGAWRVVDGEEAAREYR